MILQESIRSIDFTPSFIEDLGVFSYLEALGILSITLEEKKRTGMESYYKLWFCIENLKFADLAYFKKKCFFYYSIMNSNHIQQLFLFDGEHSIQSFDKSTVYSIVENTLKELKFSKLLSSSKYSDFIL